MAQLTLRGLVYSRYETVGSFAEAIGWKPAKARRIIREGTKRPDELLALAEHFRISPKALAEMLEEERNPGQLEFFIQPAYHIRFEDHGMPHLNSDRIVHIKSDIRYALRTFGLTGSEALSINLRDGGKFIDVTVDGCKFGVWDVARCGFVGCR